MVSMEQQVDINEEEMRVNGRLFQDALDWARFLDGTRRLGGTNLFITLRRLFLADHKNKNSHGNKANGNENEKGNNNNNDDDDDDNDD
ncbi:hypothetical protein BGZ65_000641, partial [Modicella reniformis]